MKLRAAIELRMHDRRLSRADLVRILVGRVKQRTLYAFFEGAPLNAESLQHVLDALELGICPLERIQPVAQPAKSTSVGVHQHNELGNRSDGVDERAIPLVEAKQPETTPDDDWIPVHDDF